MNIIIIWSLLKKSTFVLLVVITMVMFSSYVQGQETLEGKSIIAVFAHPDDESTIAPILARYIREGATVTLVVVTDGRFGTNDFHDHLAGETLVVIRKEEMKCAAEKLGADLIHLDYHDQLKAADGYDGHVPHARAMILELNSIVKKLEPDVLITWGPDGGSTHMDHRLVGASVTQVFLSSDWKKSMSLFYYGTPEENIKGVENKILRSQNKKYLRTKVSYSEADFEKAFNSYKCHYSQIDSTLTKEEFRNRGNKKDNVIYLRRFVAPQNDSDTVFD